MLVRDLIGNCYHPDEEQYLDYLVFIYNKTEFETVYGYTVDGELRKILVIEKYI